MSKYSIVNYNPQIQKAIKDSGIKYDKLGEIYEAPNLGYYNFTTIENNGKVVIYAELTFHANSVNGELRNTLKAFESKKDTFKNKKSPKRAFYFEKFSPNFQHLPTFSPNL